MSLLRTAILVFGLALAVGSQADEPPCYDWGGVVRSQELHFSDPREVSIQSALLDFQGRFGPSWLLARIKDSKLQIENQMPGVGLPATLYHMRLEWLSPLGKVIASKSIPEDDTCAAISLFPGQLTPDFEIVPPVSREALRLRLKIWAVVP
ncbi:MAG: hypothetical protein ABIR96_02465 [Bdellovibrionota bacterium]